MARCRFLRALVLTAVTCFGLVVVHSVSSDEHKSIEFDEAEAGLAKIRALKSVRTHPEDGSLVEEEFDYGTGIRVEEKFILTARHSIWQRNHVAERIEFWHRGQEHYRPCRALLVNADRDVAVLYCPGSKSSSFEISGAHESKKGDYLFVAGYPSYRFQKPRLLLSKGQLLNLSFTLPGGEQLPERRNLLLLDAPVYSGQSGGAVFGSEMQLVGMITKANQTSTGNWDGGTYAVAVRELLPLLDEAKKELELADDYEFLTKKQ